MNKKNEEIQFTQNFSFLLPGHYAVRCSALAHTLTRIKLIFPSLHFSHCAHFHADKMSDILTQ